MDDIQLCREITRLKTELQKLVSIPGKLKRWHMSYICCMWFLFDVLSLKERQPTVAMCFLLPTITTIMRTEGNSTHLQNKLMVMKSMKLFMSNVCHFKDTHIHTVPLKAFR